MTNKNAYTTVVTKDYYIPAVIRQFQRMKYLKCQYPFIVCISKDCSNDSFELLKKNNIQYITFQKTMFKIKDGFYQDTINKFFILTLTNFEQVMFIDADFIIDNNIDYLFDKYAIKSNNNFSLFLFKRYIREKMIFGVDGTIFICKPNKQLYDKIIHNNFLLEHCGNDETILNLLFLHESNKFVLFSQLVDGIHSSGRYKIWEYINPEFYKIYQFYYTFSYDKFNQYLNKNKNIIKQIITNHAHFMDNIAYLEQYLNEDNKYE